MEPKFQNSFIPQKPVATTFLEKRTPSPQSTTLDVLGYAASVIFVVTMISWAGLFGYEKYLSGQITSQGTQIEQAKGAFQPDAISQLVTLNTRISVSRGLLSAHLAPSQIFSLIQSLLVRRVRMATFSYEFADGKPTITADLEGQSYGALANQSKAFMGSSFITGLSYDTFSLGQTGLVTTKVKATIDPNLLSYKKKVDQSTPGVSQ